MRTSPCKGCGKLLVWAFIVKDGRRTGKRIPLDPRPIVYQIGSFDKEEYEAKQLTQAEGMVSHFNTCPYANQFSRKKKLKGE